MLISSVLLNGDMVKAVEAGVATYMFHNYHKEWGWIEDYFRKHGTTPSKNAFRVAFPANKFEILQTNDTEHNAEQVQQNHIRVELLDSLAEAFDRLKDTDNAPSNVRDYMHGELMRIAKNTGTTVDSDILTDNSDIVKELVERRDTYARSGHSGVPTGFPTIDAYLGGYGPGELHIVAARMGARKAQPLTANVLTPHGYRKMGDIKVGDEVIGSSGKPTKVVAVHPQAEPLEVYQVHVSGGTVVEVCGDHLWTVSSDTVTWRTLRTDDIMLYLRKYGGAAMLPAITGKLALVGVEDFIDPNIYMATRHIVDIVPTGEYADMQCITVEAPDSLYATEGAVLTHNSWTLQKMAVAAATEGYTVQFNALEQTRTQAAARMFSLMNTPNLRKYFTARQLIQGKEYSPDDFSDFLSEVKARAKGRLHVADASRGRVTTTTIAAQIERNKPDIVFIDYLALMGMDSYDWAGLERTAAELTQLAIQYKIPIVVAVQLNRGGAGKDAGLENIAGSDGPARYATSVLFLKAPLPNLVNIKCEKSRNTESNFAVWARFEPDQGDYNEIGNDTAQYMLDDAGVDLDKA